MFLAFFLLFFPFFAKASQNNIILAGDSIMVGIASQMKSNDNTHYYSIAKTSSGLINLNYYDIYDKLERKLKHHPNSKVYVCIGTNDGYDIDSLQFGTEDWKLDYVMRLDLLTQIAGKDNIVFVTMPEMKTLPKIKLIRQLILDYARWNELKCIDLWDALDNKYRAKDKIHCSGEGYFILAEKLQEK